MPSHEEVPMEVKGKVALVTGSGSAGGIGRSTVLELAGMGAASSRELHGVVSR